MSNSKHILGHYGETVAADFLNSLGYEILDRNWRCQIGELDLVAKCDSTIVFVEVKTRNGREYGHPFEAITAEKVSRIRRLAAAWLTAKELGSCPIRMDAISVLVEAGRVSVEHLKRVF